MNIPRSHIALIVASALVLSVLGAFGLHSVFAGPTSPPPGNNVAAPLNQGDKEQRKSGPLRLGSSSQGATALTVENSSPTNVALSVLGSLFAQGGISSTVSMTAPLIIANPATNSNAFCIGTSCIKSWSDSLIGGGTGATTGNGGWEVLFNGPTTPITVSFDTAYRAIYPRTATQFDAGYEYRLLGKLSIDSRGSPLFSTMIMGPRIDTFNCDSTYPTVPIDLSGRDQGYILCVNTAQGFSSSGDVLTPVQYGVLMSTRGQNVAGVSGASVDDKTYIAFPTTPIRGKPGFTNYSSMMLLRRPMPTP